jgi:predicted amidohydrolase
MNKLSAIQLVSRSSVSDNIASIKALLSELAPQQNQLVLLSENALCIANKYQYLQLAETLGNVVFQKQLSNLAKQYHCYLICGSFPIKSTQNDKIHTTNLVFRPVVN